MFSTVTGTQRDQARHSRLGAKWVAEVMALALVAVAVAVTVVLLPYKSVTGDSDGNETVTVISLWEGGPSILVVLVAPVLIALAPLLARGRTRQPVAVTASVLLAVFAGAATFEVGPFFLPAAIVEVVAVCLPTRRGTHPLPQPAA